MERRTFVNSNVIGLIAFNHVLWFIFGSVPDIALESNLGSEFPDDHATDLSGFRIPSNVITHFEYFCHGISSTLFA
jgi:hypothetical protein